MKVKIERLGGTQMHVSEECAHCGTTTRCRKRDFSSQAWSVLLLWGEVTKKAVDMPICDSCYSELREVLIDRADEIETAVAQPVKKPGRRQERKAS